MEGVLLPWQMTQFWKQRVKQLWMENNTAQYPVNQWIVVGEPVVSKNHRARWIEQSHIKINIHTFTGWKFYRQSYGLSDNRIRCPIKQLQLNRVYGICREFTILNKAGIHKAVSGTGVNKCRNAERRVRNKQRGQGNTERVGIRKSGHVESDNLGKGTERVNAVLRLCRGLGTVQSIFRIQAFFGFFAFGLDSSGFGFRGR